MKRWMGVLIALVVLAFAAPPAFAQEFRNGDHFCMGGSTVVKADETVDSVVLFGCGARIQSGARVREDVVSFGGNVVLEQGAHVEGDVVVFGGNVNIASEVRRDVVLFGGNLVLEPTAVIERDVILFGGLIERKEGAVVRGRVTRGERFVVDPFRYAWFPFAMPFVADGGALGILTGIAFGFVRSLIYAVLLAALGALVVVFLPTQTRQVGETAHKFALPSLGMGCLTLFVVVSLIVLLAVTLCGIPIAVLLAIALFAVGLFGWIAVGWVIGDKLLEALKARETWRVPVVAVIVGILLLAVITALPLFGWLIGLFVLSLALGAVVHTRVGTRAYPPVAPVAVAPVAPAPPSDATTAS